MREVVEIDVPSCLYKQTWGIGRHILSTSRCVHEGAGSPLHKRNRFSAYSECGRAIERDLLNAVNAVTLLLFFLVDQLLVSVLSACLPLENTHM